MDGATIIALATLGPAVIGMGVARWRQNNSISRAVGRLEGKVEGLTKAVNTRMEAQEKRVNHIQERLDSHINEHSKEA